MIRVGNQFRHCIGFGRIVVTADLTMPIHEHHPRAVDRNSLCITAVGYRELKAVMGKLVDRRFWSRKKIPAARFSLPFLRVAAQNCRRVFPWINTEGHQMHIRFF